MVAELGLGEDVEVVGELGRGAQTVVYRIRRRGADYALKVLRRSDVDTEAALTGFCREAALLARVSHPGVPRVYDVGVAGGHPYLVMDFVAGQPLSTVLCQGALAVGTLVQVAADVAAALAAAHAAGVVHRDIKPANIIMDNGKARVVDFGLAQARRAGADADVQAGTFDYTAPEQTGMLARPVDGRADLYSLGVVLFECATGALPFRADHVGELLAMHATAPTPDPRGLRPDLPDWLAEVIGRLLAKDPDDRMGTAAELHAALAGNSSHVVSPWRGEVPDAVVAFGGGLWVGRDHDEARLARRWQQARVGRGGFVLLHGVAGIGKSALADRAAAAARADGALVLAARCDADSALPLGALRRAIDQHLRTVTDLPDAARADIIARLRTAAGTGASLLRPLSPVLAALLDTPGLTGEDRHDQFPVAVASLLTGLAREFDGLLLLVDDVQWLDPASRAVLRRLGEEIAEAPVLVIATARDDDASRDAVAAFEADTEAATGMRIHLDALGDAAVVELISGYLTGSTVSPELVGDLAVRGRGNPFTILGYLHALIEAGALRPSWGTWQLDEQRLQTVVLPNDVLDLVLARIGGLGPRTMPVLTIAAAIGSRFDAGLLAQLTAEDPAPALAEATGGGLLQTGPGGHAFVHDRIREALLSTVAPNELRELHQRIAEALDQRGGTDPAHVYALAQHYAAGERSRTPERVYTTGWAAGQLALDENAPPAAAEFLQAAAETADTAGIVPDSRFREALGVAYLYTGRLDPAYRELEAGLAAETDPLRRAALLLQLARAHRAGMEATRSLACVRQGLAELGVPLPRHPVPLVLRTAESLLWWLIVGGRRRPRTDPGHQAPEERLRLHVKLCDCGAAAAGIDLDQPLNLVFIARVAGFAHRLGGGTEYVTARLPLAVFTGLLGLRRRSDKIFREIFEIADRLGDPRLRADAAWLQRTLSRKRPTDEWADVAEEYRQWLALDFYLLSIGGRTQTLLVRGYVREALSWYRHAQARLSDPVTADRTLFQAAADMAASLLGQPAEAAATLAGRALDEAVASRRVHLVLAAMQTAVEQDELGEAFDTAVQALDRLAIRPVMLLTEHRMAFVYHVWGCLTRCHRATDQQRPALLVAAKAALRRLRRLANDPLLRAYHRVAEASLYQLRGEHDQALTLLARAEPILVRLDAPLAHYEAARTRARALYSLHLEAPAGQQARAALTLASRHGWARRAQQIRAEFGFTDATRTSPDFTGRSTTATGDRYRRRLEALQQISAASATVLDPQHLARIALDETLRICGAERALLFLADEQGRLRPSFGRDTAAQDLTELSGYSATLVDRVGAEQTPLVITGDEHGAALGSQSTVVYGLRSIMIAPMELDGQLLGAVYLDSRAAKGIFTTEDVAILAAVSNHIAVSLQTARAAQLKLAVNTARQQRDTADTLRQAMNELTATLDPHQVLDHLLAIVARTLPAEKTCLLHNDGTQLRLAGAADADPTELDLGGLLTITGPCAGDDPATAPPAVAALLGDVRCWQAVPLTTRGHGTAVLLAGSTTAEAFTEAQRDITTALVSQGATAYDNARLFAQVQHLAATDALTGLSNRRRFTENATRQLSIAHRNDRPTVAMMIDIDHFKKINDGHGHAIGDEVLRTIAEILHTNIREPDLVCRYGGEEFALVLTELHGDPVAVAERLRGAVATATVTGPTGPVRATVSIGLAELKPDDSLDTLLARADAALYKAKHAGRNRVSCG